MKYSEGYIRELEKENARLKKEVDRNNIHFFKTMLESHQAVMLLIDPVSGSILDVNEAAVRFYKYSRENLLQLNIQDINILAPELLKQETQKATSNEKNYFVFQHRLADNQIRWVEVYSSSFTFQDKSMLFSIIHDITERKRAEEEVRNNEEKFSSVFRSNPNSLVLSNLEDGVIFDVNETFLQLSGLSKDEVIGKSTLDLDLYISPKDRVKMVQMLKKKGSVRNLEMKIRNYSGKELNALVSSEILKTGSKKTIITTFQDISERVQLINELKNKHTLLQAIFDTVPAMISVYEPENNEININSEFERITGWTSNDIAKSSIMELVYPDPEYRKEVEEYMHSLQPGFKEITMTGKNRQPVETLWSYVELDDGRQVGIGIDIHERKKAQVELIKSRNQMEAALLQLAKEKQALAESEQRYRIMGESLDYGVWATDAEGRATYISDSFCKLVGKSFEKIQAFGWLDTLVQEQRQEVLKLWLHSVKTGEPFEHEHQFRNKNGEIRIVLARGMPVRNEKGKIVSWAGINLDITERKKIEEQLQEKNIHLIRVNEVLEDFVQIAAHDLRSPIANLSRIIELITDQTSMESKMELFNLLAPVTRRLHNTVEGLLEMVSLQTEDQLEVTNIHIGEAWNMVSDELSARIEAFKGKIETDFNDVPEILYVEPHFASILRNLVSNAIKYSAPQEHPRIQVITKKHGEFVLLIVSDNGIGIDLKAAGDNLFKPFRRFTSTAEGTGMGLYIVKNMVRKSGGHIEVKSELNKGTAFYCYLKEYKTE